MALKPTKDAESGPGEDPEETKIELVSNEVDQETLPAVAPKAEKSEKKSEEKKTSSSDSKSSKKKQSASSLSQIRQFFSEVAAEFRKITWPPLSQTIRETWSVLFLVTVITLMVLGFDWFLGHAIFSPLEHFARMHGGGVGS
jgi:preprotein translocase SecE subunit